MSTPLSHRFNVAPMMEWTDRHCRYFHRLLTGQALLYTEMVTADAIIHGDKDYLLGFSDEEHPIALQLGGSDPEKLNKAVKLAQNFGYDEYNLNVGCPSDRVKSGRFGACLMREPTLVKECLEAMQEATSSPVTIKCRIGIDDMDDDQGLAEFVDIVKVSGIKTFIIHARKAWLNGLSPKQNREVPPLNYERVYLLKQNSPDLTIILNGGVETLVDTKQHLEKVDGVMIGRAAYHTPFILSEVDQQIYSSSKAVKSRRSVAKQMIPYIEKELAKGTKLHQITRHMLGLFHGQPGARHFRRTLSCDATREGAGVEVFKQALKEMDKVAHTLSENA